MRLSLICQTLIASVAISSTIGFTTKAHAQPETTFDCVYQNGAWQTVARRGNSRPTPPIITWSTREYEFSPRERCEIVNGKLTKLAQDHDGKLYGIRMKTGKINGSPVICYIDSRTLPYCSRGNDHYPNNHVMNLPGGSDPKLELERFFARIDTPTATGTPLQNSAPDYQVNFGDAVEKLLDATENQTGGSSPSVAPLKNQREGNSSGDSPL
jgi:hypothetical protein